MATGLGAHDPIRQRRRARSASPSSNWSNSPSDWQAHAQKIHSAPAKASPPSTSQSLLLRVPPEIIIHHLLPHLNYPSLLSLRLSHPYFYHSPLLYPARAPAIRLRVAWLLDHDAAGNVLVPTKSGCLNVGTDEGFLANPHVQELLRRERRHADCDRGEAGCRVTLGVTCGGPRKGGRLRWMRKGSRVWNRERRGQWIWWIANVLVAVGAAAVYLVRIYTCDNA